MRSEWLQRTALPLQLPAADGNASDRDEPGPDDVVRKIMADIEAKGVDSSEHRLRHRMDELLVEAKQQIIQE